MQATVKAALPHRPYDPTDPVVMEVSRVGKTSCGVSGKLQWKNHSTGPWDSRAKLCHLPLKLGVRLELWYKLRMDYCYSSGRCHSWDSRARPCHLPWKIRYHLKTISWHATGLWKSWNAYWSCSCSFQNIPLPCYNKWLGLLGLRFWQL